MVNKPIAPYILIGAGLLGCVAMMIYRAPPLLDLTRELPSDVQVTCGFILFLLVIVVSMLGYTLSLGRL